MPAIKGIIFLGPAMASCQENPTFTKQRVTNIGTATGRKGPSVEPGDPFAGEERRIHGQYFTRIVKDG
jgi:hypothetical protein